MSTLDPTQYKGMAVDEPQKEYMTYCGEYEMREGGPEHGSDGINGTIVAPQSKIEAAGAGPGDTVQVLVEANGESVFLERKIHSSGNTLTIPLQERKKLGLNSNDPIEFWIDSVDEDPEQIKEESEEAVQKTLEDEEGEEEQTSDTEPIVRIGDSWTYHYLESEDEKETACGLSLEGEEFQVGEDPGDFMTACHDCKAHSSKPMTNEEIVDWLREEIGFESSDGPPAYFKKEQLVAIKDFVVDLQNDNEELRDKNRVHSARIANLERRLQEREKA